MLTERMRDVMAMQRRRPPAGAAPWRPPLDLRATDEAYAITLDVPGARADELEATADNGLVRVRGIVSGPGAADDGRCLRSERRLGRFARSIRLPSDADTSNTSARLAGGVLEIRVGRRQSTGRINIQIEE